MVNTLLIGALMKIIIKISVLFYVLSALVSCTSASFETTSNGYPLNTPSDMKALEKSIIVSLANFNWYVTEKEDGMIYARYSKSDNLIIAEIGVEYSEEGYSIYYRDSKNLDADLDRMMIHKNYNRWIANLNKTIYNNYILFAD